MCPLCGAFIYVRTRPKDNVRVLATEKQAEILKVEWLKLTGSYEAFTQAAQEEQKAEEFRAEIRQELRRRFGKEPSDADVEWGYCNQLRMQQGLKQDWKSYRDTTFAMANLVAKEGKFKHALGFYFEVCFYDLNGPRDCAGHDAEWIRTNPPFNSEYGALQDDVIAEVQELARLLKFDANALRDVFFQSNKLQHPEMHISPEECWASMEKQLQDNPVQSKLTEKKRLQINLDGKVLEKAGRINEAIALYELGVTNGTDTPFTYDRLMVLYRKENRLEDERHVCELALKRWPVSRNGVGHVEPSSYASRLASINARLKRTANL